MRDGARLPAGQLNVNDARVRAEYEPERLPAQIRDIEPAQPPHRVATSAALTRDRDEIRPRYAASHLPQVVRPTSEALIGQ
jgi:hypothetical protein